MDAFQRILQHTLEIRQGRRRIDFLLVEQIFFLVQATSPVCAGNTHPCAFNSSTTATWPLSEAH